MQRPELSKAGRELPADIQRVLSYIEENAFDPRLNVQRIKRLCGLRDNNISSRFRCLMGTTIRAYLEERRMEAAAVLLWQSDATIMEVAFAVGYSNLQTFYGAFRRRYSCTPSAYRSAAAAGIGLASAVLHSSWRNFSALLTSKRPG